MNESPVVRPANVKDIPFLTANNLAMAHETENKRLDPKTLSEGIGALFDNTNLGFYCVAELNGRPAGQLMITYEWSDWRNGMFWWIQSVYVVAEFRRRGIYRALYRFIHDRAKSGGACGIRLYVDKGNVRAKETYAHCGMREAHYNMYEEDFVLGLAPDENS